MSVRRLGQLVSRLPRTTSASTSVHGAWQIAAIGLPPVDERTHEAHGLRASSQVVGVGDAAGQDQGGELVGRRLAEHHIDVELIAWVEVVAALHLACFRRDEDGFAAGLLDRSPRLGELDLLDSIVGDQEGNPAALQLVGHGDPPSPLAVPVEPARQPPSRRGRW